MNGASELEAQLRDARARTLALVADLTDEQLRVPLLPTLNPFLWELGHVAWFQERWLVRYPDGAKPLLPGADALYDSAAVGHDSRWEIELPSREVTLRYMGEVHARACERFGRGWGSGAAYFGKLALFHEDMHGEAFLYTRQTLALPRPTLEEDEPGAAEDRSGPHPGDVSIPGGTFRLGTTSDAPFAFDNELDAHDVVVAPFAIARAPVTQAEFAAFIDDGGYGRRDLWSDAGWAWRVAAKAKQPVYFRRVRKGVWHRRDFDGEVALEPHRPVICVNAHEAEAWCRWAGRRLPSELEWEVAAAGEPAAAGTALGPAKRRYPWGDAPPTALLANLDARAMGTVDVGALAAGDSAFGCRQMIGNVWEWTATPFAAYPGFEPGPYAEYSAPWFGTHRVLRGGAWATRSRLVHATWRNFYTPERCDVLAGFRTCRLDP